MDLQSYILAASSNVLQRNKGVAVVLDPIMIQAWRDAVSHIVSSYLSAVHVDY